MKRLGLILVATVYLTAGAFVIGNQPTAAKWKGSIDVDKLGKYLNLPANQQKEVINICDYFNEQMLRAVSSKKGQEKLVRSVAYGSLKSMKKTLSERQYADYAGVLNVTLQNKGIEVK